MSPGALTSILRSSEALAHTRFPLLQLTVDGLDVNERDKREKVVCVIVFTLVAVFRRPFHTAMCECNRGGRDLIHYGIYLEALERESSLRVLKFLRFLSAPIRPTSPSAPCVQTIPEDASTPPRAPGHLL